MTSPFFTDPPLHRVFLPGYSTQPDTQVINALLPAAADSASMILVGHGHYDHLLDVPYIANYRAKNAIIYGSPTVLHILRGDSALRAGDRVRAIEAQDVGNASSLGRWVYDADSLVRVMAIANGHAPNVRLLGGLIRYTYATGNVDHDLSRLPRTTRGWRMGPPYAYVIDFMSTDHQRPVFRILFNDAAAEPPRGLLPPFVGADSVRLDLALLCLGNANNVKGYPDSLLASAHPEHVVFDHWENFFHPQSATFDVIPRSNNNAVVSRLGNLVADGVSTWFAIPRPRTTLRFCVCS